MIRHLSIGAAGVGALLLTGCASIINGHDQSVSVVTKDKSTDVTGAKCSLSNSKGIWYVTTPGSVTVHRSYGELSVNCELEGMDDGIAAFKSSTTGAVFGNILLGGAIGAGIDIGTGAAYSYPQVLSVTMGETTAPNGKNSAPIKLDPKLTARVPYLDDAKQTKYQQFLSRPVPRAFAIASNNHYGSASLSQPVDIKLPADPKDRALLLCKRAAGQDCVLYVVDDDIVFQAPATSSVAAENTVK